MKKTLMILCALCLTIAAVLSVCTVSADTIKYGDVNGDGSINNRDLGLLQQYLNDWDVTIDAEAADVTHDGKLNNRDLGLLQQYLNDWDVTLDPVDPDDDIFNDVILPWN